MNGERNENPKNMSLLRLLLEDFNTYDYSVLQPGFWAVALHRLGNARMDVKSKKLRAPLSLAYKTAAVGVNWLWGIDLSYTVKLGRRVRIWHHGCVILNAKSIGSDVHIRHNTTLGVARIAEPDMRPTIGSGVEIGVGACVLGDVHVGEGAVIGANATIVKDVKPWSVVVGAGVREVPPLRFIENCN